MQAFSTEARAICFRSGRENRPPALRLLRHARQTRHVRPSAAGDNTPAPSAAIVTDESVPEGHRGLHSFLYGEGGAEEAHGAAAPPGSSSISTPYTFHDGEDDGTAIVPVDAYLETRSGERPVGVFAVYDSRRNLQFVSYSRNVVLSVRTLLARVGEDRCAYVRVMVFANKAMQSRATLQREADNWLQEVGTTPPGNGSESDLWSGIESSFDLASMSEEELAVYEDKKDKLLRAMGVISKEGEPEVELTIAQREANMRKAMEGGDWSAVIDAQTSETIDKSVDGTENGTASTSTAPTGPVVTPFARASVHRSVGNVSPSDSTLAMTVDTVDKVLDDVRPYLIADGGNVEVVSVTNGIIALQLQGACGTCPSSTSTMKMGIERSLRAAFGDQLKEVISIGGPPDTSATVESVDMHLNMLRGAIAAYGGSVEVLEVGNGRAILKYAGPKPIGYGMVAAVKDKFKDLKDIVVLDLESGEPIEF